MAFCDIDVRPSCIKQPNVSAIKWSPPMTSLTHSHSVQIHFSKYTFRTTVDDLRWVHSFFRGGEECNKNTLLLEYSWWIFSIINFWIEIWNLSSIPDMLIYHMSRWIEPYSSVHSFNDGLVHLSVRWWSKCLNLAHKSKNMCHTNWTIEETCTWVSSWI